MAGVSELRKIAEGREAEIFAWENGTVLRLMRESYPSESVVLQATALRAAHSAGLDVPVPGGTTIVDGRHGLIMERIDGIDLLTLIGRKPWRIWSVGTASGRLQAEMHDVAAPEGLPNLKEGLGRQIESSEVVPPEMAKFALDVLADLLDGDRLCHGDFHPGNIIKTEGRHVIIDWSNVCAGDPAADCAYTQLMIRLGEPPPFAPFLARRLAGVGRGLLGATIRRGYRSHRSPDDALVRRWEVPMATRKLSENFEEERPKLLKLLEERMNEGK